MNFRRIKKYLAKLRQWPVHPQWLIFYQAKTRYREIGTQTKGTVLDIGCADQYMKKYLSPQQSYFSLDYYQTAVRWYQTRPQVYADAQALPITSNSIDTVLLLDVLEHLPRPDDCMAEIARILKPKGQLILQVPFLYPLHDEPLDFHRWTQYGLQHLAQRHGLQLKAQSAWGHPLETAGLLYNIALSKTLLNWIKRKNILSLLGILLPIVVILVNLSCYILARFSPADSMMPYAYRLILEKVSQPEANASF
ncbi:class I SAM-dependent methyltransferase [Candidatus Venteria ishoeyi]|uniref:Methyltransferase type 11 domain-containing protein n=1 Tax=Candidatus Venteria ishoeyi TaxID=1899563 RepID=A0A1H6FCL7_9GAMM|nr:class I SAM-dependent methyltransferase [Candidatus Venteria ishoeyi]SEH07141.1 Uncharacterised protein [Candidatus Venteria ishoeyi]